MGPQKVRHDWATDHRHTGICNVSPRKSQSDLCTYLDLILGSIFCCTSSSISFSLIPHYLNYLNPRIILISGRQVLSYGSSLGVFCLFLSFAPSYTMKDIVWMNMYSEIPEFLQSQGEFRLELYWIHKGTEEPLDEGERGEWKSWHKLSIQKAKIMASGPITSW